MTRINRNSLITVIIITVITLYRFVFPSENGDDYKDKIREKEIKSTVSKKYIDYEITVFHILYMEEKIV